MKHHGPGAVEASKAFARKILADSDDSDDGDAVIWQPARAATALGGRTNHVAAPEVSSHHRATGRRLLPKNASTGDLDSPSPSPLKALIVPRVARMELKVGTSSPYSGVWSGSRASPMASTAARASSQSPLHGRSHIASLTDESFSSRRGGRSPPIALSGRNSERTAGSSQWREGERYLSDALGKRVVRSCTSTPKFSQSLASFDAGGSFRGNGSLKGTGSFRMAGSGGWTAELEERLKTSGTRGRPPAKLERTESSSSSSYGEHHPPGSGDRQAEHHGAVKQALSSMWANMETPHVSSTPTAKDKSTVWVVAAAEEAVTHTDGEDPALSFAGMQHAMETGAVMRVHSRARGERRVVCGPSLASVQTAHYIAWCIGGRVCIEPGLADPGCSKHPQHPSARQRGQYHPTVDASHKPCTAMPWGEETMIEGLPRAVDACNKIAATVGRGEDVIVVAGPAVATAFAATMVSGCSASSPDKSHPLRLQQSLATTSPVVPCGVFKLRRSTYGGAWACDMSAGSSHISTPSPPQAPFELLAAGDPRDWILLWECLRRLHAMCQHKGTSQVTGEAKLRADVALQSMCMARAALPTLLRGSSEMRTSGGSPSRSRNAVMHY